MNDARRLLDEGPRAVALHALLGCRKKESFVQDVLDRSLEGSRLTGADRRLAVNLVYTILRRRPTLDHLLQYCCNRPQHQVEPWLWDALRLGAAQLICMTHIPPHAAIYETVQLAEIVRKPSAKRFLNGILRSLTRLVTDETQSLPAADAFPLDSGVYRRLSGSVLPDPSRNPLQYLLVGFGFPTVLAQSCLERYDWDECLRLGFWFSQTPSMWLRCNRLRANRESVAEAFAAAEIACETGDLADSIRLTETRRVHDLPGFDDGLFSVQDESAMRVALALDPSPGDSVLDLCAAPGGKTTHLAELMNNQGKIVACDVDAARIQRIDESCQRLGITIVHTKHLDTNHQFGPSETFDAVLVDAPCSNTGVMGRRPEIRWRLKLTDLQQLIVLQTKLLTTAAERAKPNGVIVYSTCSIEPKENRGVVDAVMKTNPQLLLECDQTQTPGRPSDGGYWAKLRRR